MGNGDGRLAKRRRKRRKRKKGGGGVPSKEDQAQDLLRRQILSGSRGDKRAVVRGHTLCPQNHLMEVTVLVVDGSNAVRRRQYCETCNATFDVMNPEKG